jgi:hypothetical protein
MLHVTNSIDSFDSRSQNQAEVGRALGALAAVLTWVAWLTICPALGFPSLGTAAIVNRAIFTIFNFWKAGYDPDFWLGWVIVVAALVVAIAVFVVLNRAHLLRTGLRTGVIYGVALWLVAGVVIMPLLGLIKLPDALPPNLDPMQATLMMYSLGPLAPVAALIAWVLFGAILGTTAEHSSDPA